MTSRLINSQWVVAQRPTDDLKPDHFAYQEVPVRELEAGEMLLKSHYLNVVPVMRMYMLEGGAANEKPLALGDVIHGRGVAEVVASRHADYHIGEFVHGQLGWQTYKITRATEQEKFVKMVRRDLPAYYGLSALGMTGYSAYFGFVERGQPKAGDAVLVSGAVGGVGSLVMQMAKAKQCGTVVGIAGGAEKCALGLTLGADAMIDYKQDDVAAKLGELFPAGIDIYFDNVGGEILEAALENLAYAARVVLCGSISEYQRTEPFGLRNYTRLRKVDADMRGFFVYNHIANYAAAEAEMAEWIKQNQLTVLADICDGFEHMPAALIGLYQGANKGKQIVRVCPGGDVMY